MWIHTKINAEGGENEIHSHLDEDHSFIVLEGQMSVFDETGREMKVEKYQGVMIPKGAYYRYLNTGCGKFGRHPDRCGHQRPAPRRCGNARPPRRQAAARGIR